MNKKEMLIWLVGMAINKIDPDKLREWADMGLDAIEDAVADSPNKIDDAVVLPMCKIVREGFDIVDND